ncbi:hypothetical protein [Pseudoalteromonas peptidolytica]|uniref:hypothetical protein n=1 Tax=Pseudoalteromonas peptidolytica TaxID=61150 RepID=UPI00298E5F82|nr:hypothetical protein [Pseudoalteromonas peptidolytica]MDW7548196.1 hypothetical protein [Pseudoalteromonas peptidolytica]
MSDLQNMADLVSTGNQLLDDIRGGAISRMAHEHQTQQAEFKSEHDAKQAEFASSHNTVLQQQTAAGNAKIAEIDSYIANGRDQQTHMRLTKNQVLQPNALETHPLHWAEGFIKRATLLETVKSGVATEQRSELAREFLNAINSDTTHFAGAFNIWELEIRPNRLQDNEKRESYFLYQYVRYSQAITLAAVVKHIKGAVPTRFFCQGLQANQPAKLCGQTIQAGTSRNFYTHTTAQVFGLDREDEDTTIIQIALPAAVTGVVDLSKGAWGQFPYIGDSAYD